MKPAPPVINAFPGIRQAYPDSVNDVLGADGTVVPLSYYWISL